MNVYSRDSFKWRPFKSITDFHIEKGSMEVNGLVTEMARLRGAIAYATWRKQRVPCPQCGFVYNRSSLKTHVQTKRCVEQRHLETSKVHPQKGTAG
jgi:hypothetical protein